jgi:hypothetical protein
MVCMGRQLVLVCFVRAEEADSVAVVANRWGGFSHAVVTGNQAQERAAWHKKTF